MKFIDFSLSSALAAYLGMALSLECQTQPLRLEMLEKGLENTPALAPGGSGALPTASDTNALKVVSTPNGQIKLSTGLAEIIELAQSGVGDEVLIAFIENSPIQYDVSSEEIVYLTDLGLSEPVLKALLNKKSGATQKIPGETSDVPSAETVTSMTNACLLYTSPSPRDS